MRDAAEIAPETLTRLPLTRREELVRDQLAQLPHGTRRFADAGLPVRAGATGSGETLLVLTWSAADLARERAAGARVLARLGVAAGMRVANTLPGALATPGALLLGDVIEELGALDVPLGVIENETAARQAWELVDRVQPAVMILEPMPAARLFAVAPAAARPWWQGIIWLQRSAAPVQSPALPDGAGFQGWQRTWLAVPEATSFVASSCALSRFHVDEGVVAEIVDDATGEALPPERGGTLALTPLGVDTPVMRYASGVRARAISAPCACGTGGLVLELPS
ncbi:MAG TPA: hypothetical protein VN812_18215 [Candidatus Acidoferrales bacterium]|nr:hypothetical protein [Candidatus Acidoferrales bacterium]